MARGDHDQLITELERFHAYGTPPAVTQTSPFRWATACHELLEDGRIDVLEPAAHHLHTAFPDLDYLATLVEWFDAIPHHLAGPRAFSDQPKAEIQIVPHAGCDKVLLCFCAQEGTFGVPINLAHQWLGRLPASLIYIKDFRDLSGGGGYPSLGPDRASSITALQGLVKTLGATRAYTIGVSSGGYAAVYYGLMLGAVAVLGLGGKTDLTPGFVQHHGANSPLYCKLLQKVPDYATDLGTIYEAATRCPRVLLAYSAAHEIDRQQAERMAGLSSVELIAVGGQPQHNVIDPLIRRREFFPLLHRLMAL